MQWEEELLERKTAVFIAYISLDEVNQDLAARTAEKYGVTLDFFASPAGMATLPCDAVVYDLDSLSRDDRLHIFDELTCGPVKCLAAVHCYNMRPIEEAALRRNGVVVHRRLHSGWLSHLIRGRTGKVGAQLLAGSCLAVSNDQTKKQTGMSWTKNFEYPSDADPFDYTTNGWDAGR